jgi:hypothetical protein
MLYSLTYIGRATARAYGTSPLTCLISGPALRHSPQALRTAGIAQSV